MENRIILVGALRDQIGLPSTRRHVSQLTQHNPGDLPILRLLLNAHMNLVSKRESPWCVTLSISLMEPYRMLRTRGGHRRLAMDDGEQCT